jgi:hypothetical protein
MQLKVFPLLDTRCKRLMQRRKCRGRRRRGQTYHYNPQTRLINRLASQLRMPPDQVRQQIAKERLYLLQQIYGLEITKKDV